MHKEFGVEREWWATTRKTEKELGFYIMMDIREIYWKDGKQWRSEFFDAWGELPQWPYLTEVINFKNKKVTKFI